LARQLSDRSIKYTDRCASPEVSSHFARDSLAVGAPVDALGKPVTDAPPIEPYFTTSGVFKSMNSEHSRPMLVKVKQYYPGLWKK
jgi:hypothetical protein